MKRNLTIEQSRDLIDLCVSRELDSLYYVDSNETDCLAFTLADIFQLLPPILPIDHGAYLYITHDSVEWVVSYCFHGATGKPLYFTSAEELIDAMYYMIIHLKNVKAI